MGRVDNEKDRGCGCAEVVGSDTDKKEIGMGTTPDPGPYWKPISLQYRPYTANGDNVRKESLNPKDEYGEYVNRSYYGASTYATNESDLDFVISIKQKLPADAKLILVIDADRPMNGLAPGSSVKYGIAPWQYGVYGGTAVLVALGALLGYKAVKTNKALKEQKAHPADVTDDEGGAED